MLGAYEAGGVKLQIALGSGAVDHVINPDDLPGYELRPSAGGNGGAAFQDASGNPVANLGQFIVEAEWRRQ